MSNNIIGVGNVTKKLGELSADNKKSVFKKLVALGLKYEGDVKKEINTGSRSGRIYKRRTVTHQSSAAGEAPKTDTGRLVASIKHRIIGDKQAIEVFSALDYAKSLEFGTSKMQPRPVWIPTLHAMKPLIKKTIEKEVQRIIDSKKKK